MTRKIQDVGRVVNTHGLRGELKIECWCDGPGFMANFDKLIIDGETYVLNGFRAHKNMALVTLDGVDGIDKARALKGLVAQADVSGVELPEDRWFVQDLIGLVVVDDQTGYTIGKLEDVLKQPAHDVYAVRDLTGAERLIPAVDAFVKSVDMDARVMRVALIEGM